MLCKMKDQSTAIVEKHPRPYGLFLVRAPVAAITYDAKVIGFRFVLRSE